MRYWKKKMQMLSEVATSDGAPVAVPEWTASIQLHQEKNGSTLCPAFIHKYAPEAEQTLAFCMNPG